MKKEQDYVKVLEHLEAYQKLADPEQKNDLGFACVGLHHPHNDQNVGAALRAAGCFQVAFLAIAGERFRKASTDVKHQYRQSPLLLVEDLQKIIPYACVPVAVELVPEAVSLPEYEHPHRAFYIFGGEHETLGRSVLKWCRDVVFIPTNGSLNLGACVNVVLYDRLVKTSKRMKDHPAKIRI